MRHKLKSRKFWLALIGATLPIAAQFISQDIAIGEALQLSTLTVVSYIFGQGYVDANAAAAEAKK